MLILLRNEMKRSFAFEESDISSSEVQDDVDFEYVEEDEIMEVGFFWNIWVHFFLVGSNPAGLIF